MLMSSPAGMCGVPFGVIAVCHAGRELHPAPVELDRAAEVRVEDLVVVAELPADLVGQLDDRDDRRAGALGDVDGVADVVGVAVGEQDVRRRRPRRPRLAAFGLPVRNGSMSTRRAVVLEQEAGVAEEA